MFGCSDMRKTRNSKKEPRELILSSDESEAQNRAKRSKVLKGRVPGTKGQKKSGTFGSAA